MPDDEQQLALDTLLSIDDEDERYNAAFKFARSDNRATAWGLDWYQLPAVRAREIAATILGRVCPNEGSPKIEGPCVRTVPVLIEAARSDSDAEVRWTAIYGLMHHSHPDTIPIVIEFVNDPNREVRLAAASCLGGFYGCNWNDTDPEYRAFAENALLQLMDDPDDDVRDWATFGIHQGDHDSPAARARLWKALEDPNPDVRGEATEGLAKFGDRNIIPKLRELLEDEETLSPCYFVAAEALGADELIPAMRKAAQRWLDWCDGIPDSRYTMIRNIVDSMDKPE